MTSYPKRKDLFTKWSKAMVEGATVDKPNYSPASRSSKKSYKGRTKQWQQRRRRRKKGSRNGSKD